MKGMKSHDYHVKMKNMLLLCMQHLVIKGCKMVIIYLFWVWKKLCAKIFDPKTMGEMKQNVAFTLILFKKKFLPCFLTSHDTFTSSFSGNL
jgi:hypothetical protein